MSRARLNKSTLAAELRKLARYREFLPSLDLKRQQLLAELARERESVRELQAQRERLFDALSERVPMLADQSIALDGLVALDDLSIRSINRLGTLLPVIDQLKIRRADYSMLARPHWVDAVAAALEAALRIDVELDVAHERQRLLDLACKTTTRRVNLFEKVLIPRAEGMIRRIRIGLADAERYSAIRAKFAKAAARRRVSRELAL